MEEESKITSSVHPLYEPFPAPRAGHSPKQYGFRLPGITRESNGMSSKDTNESAETQGGSLRRYYFQHQAPERVADDSPASPIVFIERGTNTTMWTTLRCIENFIGTGIFLIPGTLSQVGLFGILTMIAIASIMWYTASLLERCQRANGLESYPEVICAAYPDSQSRFIISAVVYLHILINLSIYVTFARISVQNSIEETYVVPVFSSSDFSIVAILLVLGLAMIYTIWTESLFKIESFLKLAVISSTLLIMVSTCIRRRQSIDFSVLLYGDNFSYSSCIESTAVYCYCFLGHKTLPTLYTGMARTSQFPNVLGISMLSVTVIYLTVSILGCVLYSRGLLEGFYLLQLRPIWLSVVFLAMFIGIVLSKFLNESSALTEGLVESLNLKQRLLVGRGRGYSVDAEALIISCQELVFSIVLKIVLPILSLMISCAITDVYKLVALNGGVFGVFLCWILPILSFQRLLSTSSLVQMRSGSEDIFLLCLLIVGYLYASLLSFWFIYILYNA